jgi:2,4-dienoyl-CoA reductase-like NADH-dependent reductase (Old Yellow Enzyme family)
MEEVAPEEPQWRVEDSARLAHILADHGVDMISVSAGGINSRQRVARGEAYQAPYAATIKNSVGDKILVAAVGGLGNGPLAQRLLDNGTADIIFSGRGFLKNPGLVWAMADDLGVEIHNANQIEWGFRGRGKRAVEQAKQTKEEL